MATYQGSGITRTPFPRGTVPQGGVKVAGVLQLGNVTINNGDNLQLCYIPYGSFISGFDLITSAAVDGGGNTLSLKLIDTLASPTQYIATLTGWNAARTLGGANLSASTYGTNYGSTSRSIGTSGPQVVVWASGVLLELQATAGAAGATGGTVNIAYQVQFHACYDMGV